MKTIILATAATLTLAGSAIAGNFDGSTSAHDFAVKHFAQSYSEGDGPRGVFMTDGGDNVVSSKNANLAELAKQKLFNDRGDER